MDTPITEMTTNPIFYLLQISDSFLPIGGYTQSFGLETYVQKGIVHNSDTAQKYLESYLLNNFLYNDLLAVKLTWEYVQEENLEAICNLAKILSAAKSPREIRTASIKLGTRLAKIVGTVLGENHFFASFMQLVKNDECKGHYSVIYGMTAKLFNIQQNDALSAIIYNTASSIINNCGKLVPLSQKDGQDILFTTQVIFHQLIDKVKVLNEDSIGICGLGFDLRAMQHERLYTRLYIS